MKQPKIYNLLVFLIACVAVVASSAGIFTRGGPGEYEHMSIRGKSILIYGTGLYRDMSADVAIQGIAQDYVTLFIAVPLLLVAWFFSRSGSLKWRFMLAGTLSYFLVTYLMYLGIAMYNAMFLAYVVLIGTSLFAVALTLLSFDLNALPQQFGKTAPIKLAGGFLIFNSIIISLLWLGVVLPPLLDGTIVPDAVQHYTTLTVQGLDLAIFLPLSFVAGYLLINRKPLGYLLSTTTLIFLPLLMSALVAKIIAMGLAGDNIVPVVFIMPVLLIAASVCAILLTKNLNSQNQA